jgi:predicted transcriptional regulator
MRKDRLNVYFDSRLTAELEALAARRKVSKSQIVEAALASYLSPDAADQREAAIVRRLDRLTRAVERLERNQTIAAEALALFVRFWLTTTPPLPDAMRDAAQAKGRERYEGFVEALGRRLAKGSTLTKEVSLDVGAAAGVSRNGAADRD